MHGIRVPKTVPRFITDRAGSFLVPFQNQYIRLSKKIAKRNQQLLVTLKLTNLATDEAKFIFCG
jgi:hypothetical protein